MMNFTDLKSQTSSWLRGLSYNIGGTEGRQVAMQTLTITERDLEILRSIKKFPDLLTFCRVRLGVTEDEVKQIQEERSLSAKQRLDKFWGSNVTFRRFLSYAVEGYEEHKKQSNGADKKKEASVHLKDIRRLANTSLETKESILELLRSAYYLFRTIK